MTTVRKVARDRNLDTFFAEGAHFVVESLSVWEPVEGLKNEDYRIAIS